MSRELPLTRGLVATVDDDDYGYLALWKWYAQPRTGGGGFYAVRRASRTRIVFMHRIVNATPEGALTDHINGDGLDNRKSNLRTATPLQNMMNRIGKKRGTSRHKGVWLDKQQAGQKQWHAGIRVDGRLRYLGRFKTEAEAGEAYAKAATCYFGEFANVQAGAGI